MSNLSFLGKSNELNDQVENGSLKTRFSNSRSSSVQDVKSPKYLTIEDAASYLSLTVSSIRNMIYRGVLPRYNLGRRVLLKKAEIDQLVESSKKGGSHDQRV